MTLHPIVVFISSCAALAGIPRAEMALGAAFSAGEIRKQDSYDMMRTTGIYGYGASFSLEGRYWESSLQLESGAHNRSAWYGSGIDCNGKYGFAGERIKAYAGLGFAYNGYVSDSWLGPTSVRGEFTHDFSPYLATKVELFQRLRVGFEGNFASDILWKARIGLQIFRFR